MRYMGFDISTVLIF